MNRQPDASCGLPPSASATAPASAPSAPTDRNETGSRSYPAPADHEPQNLEKPLELSDPRPPLNQPRGKDLRPGAKRGQVGSRPPRAPTPAILAKHRRAAAAPSTPPSGRVSPSRYAVHPLASKNRPTLASASCACNGAASQGGRPKGRQAAPTAAGRRSSVRPISARLPGALGTGRPVRRSTRYGSPGRAVIPEHRAHGRVVEQNRRAAGIQQRNFHPVAAVPDLETPFHAGLSHPHLSPLGRG